MRTQEEILKRIDELKEDDPLGFEISIYISALDYEHAKPFLKPDTTPEQWNHEELTDETIKSEMLNYMPFAWKKANDCRGISANRSIGHYQAWLWLLGDGFLNDFNSIEYEHYGKEQLIAVCEKYGWDWKQWDNGVRTNYDG